MVEEEAEKLQKNELENFININSFTSLGSLTLIGSLIAIHVHDYLKARESKQAEA